jgi:hypothetical protein
MATKRPPTPGEADRLIAHQARLLKAPRIAAHYHRLAEQGGHSSTLEQPVEITELLREFFSQNG